MPLSRFDDPPEGRPDVWLSGHLDDFVPGTRVRLRITVTQRTTGAIAIVEKIVKARKFKVTTEDLIKGQVEGSRFDETVVVATAQAMVQWGKELKLRRG